MRICKLLGYKIEGIFMILEEDFQNILENYSNISTLYNKTILVTGATGFIGSFISTFFPLFK